MLPNDGRSVSRNITSFMTCKLKRHHQFFWYCRVPPVKFSYWSKFHANIMTCSEVRTIFKIGNNPVWVLPNIWRLGRVSDTKFDTNVSNIKLLNTAKCQGCSIYRFWFTCFFISNGSFENRMGHAYGKSLFRLKVCLHYAYLLKFC